MVHLRINSENEQEYVDEPEADIFLEKDTWDISDLWCGFIIIVLYSLHLSVVYCQCIVKIPFTNKCTLLLNT